MGITHKRKSVHIEAEQLMEPPKKRPRRVISEISAKKEENTVEPIVETVSHYTLRKRKSVHFEDEQLLEPNKKRACRQLVKIIRKPKFIRSIVLEIGSVVLAHMPTYSEWPACILRIDKSRVLVSFFGENLTGTVNADRIGPIDQNSELIKYLLKKKINKYKKAVLEMELFQNVPSHLSIIDSYVISIMKFQM